MMDTAKLLAELDASDAICAAATELPWDAVDVYQNDHAAVLVHSPVKSIFDDRGYALVEDADFCAHARTELPARNKQLREALSRIAELEAVGVPLERLVTRCMGVRLTYYDRLYLVAVGKSDDHQGNTLAEALSAADKAMEDAT